ncbi:MAG: alpha-amylase family glycosyl hydrolase [Saprospiraceae bacterium]
MVLEWMLFNLLKDTTWPVFPEGHEKDFIKWYGMRPQLHTYLNEMYNEVMAKYDVFAEAEGAGSSFQDAHDLVDADRNELQTPITLNMWICQTPEGYELSALKTFLPVGTVLCKLKGWLAIFLSNHDNARLVNRFGNPSPAFRTPSTQLLNTFLLSMRGTPYTYYGMKLA